MLDYNLVRGDQCCPIIRSLTLRAGRTDNSRVSPCRPETRLFSHGTRDRMPFQRIRAYAYGCATQAVLNILQLRSLWMAEPRQYQFEIPTTYYFRLGSDFTYWRIPKIYYFELESR